jgi:hypothetical protein
MTSPSSLHLGKSNKRYLLPAQVDLWLIQTIQWVGSIMQVVPTFYGYIFPSITAQREIPFDSSSFFRIKEKRAMRREA